MKTSFIVTSSIDVDNNHPLTYSKVRSYFTSEERLRQTINTIAAIDQVSNIDTDIFIIDVSDTDYSNIFAYQQNLKYISVKLEFQNIYNTVKTHPNKSFCELLILLHFFEKYNHIIDNYDYIFKISGRYFIDGSFKLDICTEQNRDKIFYKRPFEWQWKDEWNYHMVDLRSTQQDNTLKQYPSTICGWGSEKHHQMISMFQKSLNVLRDPNMSHYDIETLGYYFTRDYKDDIIETDWKIYGWHGHNGSFVRY